MPPVFLRFAGISKSREYLRCFLRTQDKSIFTGLSKREAETTESPSDCKRVSSTRLHAPVTRVFLRFAGISKSREYLRCFLRTQDKSIFTGLSKREAETTESPSDCKRVSSTAKHFLLLSNFSDIQPSAPLQPAVGV